MNEEWITFKQSKGEIIKIIILKLPIFEKGFVTNIDAFCVGMGVILEQDGFQ